MINELHYCIHTLFESQVEKTPESKAVVQGNVFYTYRELNERGNQLAHHLISVGGLRPGNLVAVCCERSPLLIIALLAIQKAGGAYVPLDPEYPEERLKYMVEDCQPKILLYEDKTGKNLSTRNSHTTRLDIPISIDSSIFLSEKVENPALSVTADQTLYIIYTSGSTGKPKGTIVYHRGFHNLLNWYCRKLHFGHDSKVLLITSFSFDLTQKNIFAPLITGGCLFLPTTQIYDADIILEEIRQNFITSVNCTPSAFYGLVADSTPEQLNNLSSLRHVVLGGEPIIIQRLKNWIESEHFHAEIINSYGPTECTDVVAFFKVEDQDQYDMTTVPIGRPIDNTELFVMDSGLREVSAGQEGELCIAGAGVGGGYLNRPEYTAERFCRHPFDKHKIIYRTGDRARSLEGGDLQYLGRIDQQVKVRGFRIEPGEIEAKLESIRGIKEAVVLAKPDSSGENRLIAYIVRPPADSQKNISEIRSQLQQDLPDFMLPSAWVFLDKMPLSPNGKLDRDALPDPENNRPELSQAYLRATTPVEEFLADMWRQLLNLDRVGIRDRFFELGGTSVKAIQFIAQISKELEEKIPIAAFFAAPTIEGFIRLLDKNHQSALRKRFPDHQSVLSQRSGSATVNPKPMESEDEIAVIGFSGRFPGAEDVDDFWKNLRNGIESVEFASEDHLRLNGVAEEDISDPSYLKAYFSGAELDGFDAEFFGYSPREVELMDPQHRLFLELAWTALDNAGYSDPGSRQGRIGVYGGTARDAYLHDIISKHPDYTNALGEFFINLGNDKNFPATRIAYKLNLTGPAFTVQTACSTSGIALHLACQSLRLRECEMALVGGCRIISPPDIGYLHFEGGPFSEDGHLRTFDASATGMVRGSGGAFLVVKRLNDARRDGDCIRGIIKSTAVNNDGEAKIGFTAPSIEGQEEVIREALERASIDPESVTLVEAHGTATVLGDPIEVTALTNAYRHYTGKKGYCWLGSVKPNIGHLDAGSANASIIKVLLAMEHAEIPPSLNFKNPNPNVDIVNSPFVIADSLKKWEFSDVSPRRAGVSSFGLGGTNFHAIMEEVPPPKSEQHSSKKRPWQIVTLSAKSEVSLNANIAGLPRYLRNHTEQTVANLAYSLNCFRPPLSHRAFLLYSEESGSRNLDLRSISKNITGDNSRSIVFLYPGEYEIPVAQLQILLDSEPQLHRFIDECRFLLQEKEECLDNNQRKDFLSALSIIERTFIMQYGLSRLWIDWGIAPTAVYSSGVGKLCAACIAGILTLAEVFQLLDAIKSGKKKVLSGFLSKCQGKSTDIPFITESSDTWVGRRALNTADFWLKYEDDGKVSTEALRLFGEWGTGTYLQITPGLSFPAGTDNDVERSQTIPSLPLDADDDPAETLTTAVARIWLQGLPLDWKRYYAGYHCRKIPLPPFRFDRHRFWLDLPNAGPKIITISANSESELQHGTKLWAEYLRQNPGYDLKQPARADESNSQAYRLGIVAFNSKHAGEILTLNKPDTVHTNHRGKNLSSVVFMFPGGGIQYLRMGYGLYKRYGDFRYSIDKGLSLFSAHTGYDLKRVWFAAEHARDWAVDQLRKPSVQLPAVFILEMALAKLWMKWGMQPSALIGHSLGENSAACLAGVLSYEETLKLVSLRGRLFEEIEGGGMLSVGLSTEALRPYLNDQIDVAVINGPELCTISGEAQHLEIIQMKLEEDGIESRLIPIATAAHSRLLDPVLPKFEAYLRQVDLQPPRIPMISNFTGDWLSDESAVDPAYWVKHLRNTVLFAAGVDTLVNQNQNWLFVEIGPGKSLSAVVKSLYPEKKQDVIPSLGHQHDPTEDELFFLSSVCRVQLAKTQLSRVRIDSLYPGIFLDLPAYPPVAGKMQASIPVTQSPASLSSDSTSTTTNGRTVGMSRNELIIKKIKSIIEEMSGVPKSDMDSETTFLDMGFDSLFLTQLNLRFKKFFKVKITLKQVFGEAPTISALSKYIDGQLSPDALQEELEVQLSPAPSSSDPTPPPVFPGNGEAPADLQQAIALHIQTSNALLGYLQGTVTVQQQAPVPQPPARISLEKQSPPQSIGVNHGPYAPLQKTIQTELTDRQKDYLHEFIDKYQRKTQKSKALAVEIRPNYADPRTVMGFKTLWKELTYSIAAERSKGSRVWDVDGNEYVDCMGGFGAILFGHAPDFVLDAVRKQLDSSIDYGPQSVMAGRVAGLFCEMTGMERVSFCNTGSEADLAAIRIARTVTGNDLIVCFQGAYHGIFDEVLARRTQAVGGEYRNQPVAPGIPDTASQNILILDYDDKQSLEIIRERSDEIAGVIVEPVQSRHPEIQPREFLQKLRSLTAELEIPLIFDEIITGFRLHPRGAQGWFGVKADLACYGKVIGGGFPVGIIAGKREYMDALDGGHWNFGDDSFPEVGVTYFAGTFVRHPVALAATEAVLLKLKEEGEALQRGLNKKTAIFAETVNRRYRQLGVPIELVYFGSAFFIRYKGNADYEGLFWHHLRYFGAHHIFGNRPCFLTTSHTEKDMAALVESFIAAAVAMQEGGFLPVMDELSTEFHPWVPVQNELWLAIKIGEKSSAAYNEQVMFEIDKDIDQNILELVIDKVINRHPSLRAVVNEDEQGLHIKNYMQPRFTYEDLSYLPEGEQEGKLANLVRCHIDLPFDFKNGPLLRVLLVRKSITKNVLCVCASHLVCDGWSLEIVMEDIASYYSGISQSRYVKGRNVPQLEVLRKVIDELESSGETREARDYWLSIYGDTLPPDLNLPLDYPRPQLRTFSGERHHYYLDTSLILPLRRLAKEFGCTSFVLMLAVYQLLLQRLTNQNDIVIGVPAAGQPYLDLADAVTHSVAFLPLRVHIDNNQKFYQYLLQTRENFMSAKDSQAFAYGEIIKEVPVERNPSRLPLVTASFNMDMAYNPLDFDGVWAQFKPAPRGLSKYDLLFTLTDEGENILIEVDRNSSIIKGSTIDRWVAHYIHLLREVSDNPRTPIKDITTLDAKTRQTMLVGWNDTQRDYSLGQVTLDGLLEESFEKHPHGTAVIDSKQQLSFLELDRMTSQLAHYLRSQDIEKNSMVAVMLERSVEMVVALNGIIRAGAAYLPLDPGYPSERIRYILEESESKIIITQDKFRKKFPESVTLFSFETDWYKAAAYTDGRPEKVTRPDDLAYVIYTSGSTGKPKGVMNEHRGICNRLLWMQETIPLTSKDRVLQKTPYTFDVSVWEFFLPQLAGATLVMAKPEGHKETDYLVKTICDYKISYLHFVPSMLHLFLQHAGVGKCLSLTRVICSGEALTAELRDAFFEVLPKTELHNLYGPTEAAVDVTHWVCSAMDRDPIVPIGRPVSNTQTYILDQRMNPVSVGVAGELHIGGVQVARGYLNQPELTAEKFVPDTLSSRPKARLYKTGDIARYRDDGAIEYLGRNDYQVKIRGNRVELGEIEAVLLKDPQVRQCFVTLWEKSELDQRLVAFIVPEDQEEFNALLLRKHLRQHLPGYMIPQHFEFVDVFPLTTSGKLDRKRLINEKHISLDPVNKYVAPESVTEKQLAALWKEIIGVEKVGVHDNFFNLGGHSLLSMKFIDQVYKSMGVKITPGIIMFGTLGQIAHEINDSLDDTQSVMRKKHFPN